jgi:hypothetical protein
MAGNESFNEPYTVQGPYNYGVFSPKIPYSFPSHYEDPHLESMGACDNRYSGFGQFIAAGGAVAAGCETDDYIRQYARIFLNALRIPKFKVDIPFVGSISPEDELVKVLQRIRPKIEQLVQMAANNAHSEFMVYFANNIAPGLASAMNSALAQVSKAIPNVPAVTSQMLIATVGSLLWNATVGQLRICRPGIKVTPTTTPTVQASFHLPPAQEPQAFVLKPDSIASGRLPDLASQIAARGGLTLGPGAPTPTAPTPVKVIEKKPMSALPLVAAAAVAFMLLR